MIGQTHYPSFEVQPLQQQANHVKPLAIDDDCSIAKTIPFYLLQWEFCLQTWDTRQKVSFVVAVEFEEPYSCYYHPKDWSFLPVLPTEHCRQTLHLRNRT
jgi:hypothetical protein